LGNLLTIEIPEIVILKLQ